MPRMFFEMLADVDTAQDWQFAFDTNEVVMGRDPAADIPIPSQTVSRFHAAITWDGDQFLLTDRSSRNGTYLNDTRLEAPAAIKTGDVIGLGHSIKLTFSTQPPRELELVGMTLSDTGAPIMEVVEEVLQLSPPLLLVSIGGATPIRYTLTGQHMKVGRSDDNDIVINSPIVSRYHAEIKWEQDHFELVPNPEARNRVLIDGIAAERPVRIKHGQIFQIGRKDPATTVMMEVDYPNAPSTSPDPAPLRDDIFKTQKPDKSAERTVVRNRSRQIETPNMLWLPRSPDVLLPSFDDILRSGPLNEKLAEGVECYAIRGDAVSDDVLSLPRGRLFVHRSGMFFLPLGAKKMNVADLADIGIEVAGFMFDLGLNLIPGGVLIGAVGGLVGKLIQNSMHAALKSKKPVPRTYWMQHPHTFHIPYTGIVRAGLPTDTSKAKSSAQVFCEIGTKTQAYTFIGVGEGTKFFSEMFVAALFVNRFVQERSEVGSQVLDNLVGAKAASVKITDRFVQKHGELREEHLQQISDEVEDYVNTALEQKGYTCAQVDAMTLDKLSHFSQLPQVPSLAAIHQALAPV